MASPAPTRAAARYLKELYSLFGDWDLALAGYNAGEAKVLRAVARYKTSDYWTLRRTRAFRHALCGTTPQRLANLHSSGPTATFQRRFRSRGSTCRPRRHSRIADSCRPRRA